MVDPNTPDSTGAAALDSTKPPPSVIGQSRGTTPALAGGGPLPWPDSLPSDGVQALIRAAASVGQAIIYRPDGAVHRLPYAQLHQNALGVLAGLQHAGLKPGQTLLVAANDAEVLLTGLWAAILGGLQASAIELPDTQAEFSAYQRLDAACTLLDNPPLLLDSIGAAARAHIPAIHARQVLDFDTLHQTPGHLAKVHSPDPTDTALIILTSGSTGLPKGVMQSHQALVAMTASLLGHACNAGANDVLMNWLPRDHVGAMAFVFMGAVILQASQVHADVGYVLAQPERWLQLVDTEKVSITWSPNFAYELLARAARATSTRYNLASLRAIFNGGEAVNEHALLSSVRDLEQHGLNPEAMIPAFGMSETCAGISRGRLGHTIGAFTSLGRPIAGSRFRIVDDNNRVLTEGEIGNIHVESPQLFTRYFGQHEQPPRVGDTGWFDTGDAGFIANGALYVTGRIKDTLNVRGVTLFAHELENTLARIPGIDPTRLAVTPFLPEGATTEEIAVYFSSYPEAGLADDATLSGLIAAIHDSLRSAHAVATHYLVPLSPTAFPLTPVGKIIKKELRQRLERGDYASSLQRAHDLGKMQTRRAAGSADDNSAPATDPAAPCLAAFIAQLLEEPAVGAHDDFFLIGGDSVSATRLAAELSEWFFTDIPVAVIFQCPTPHALAEHLRHQITDSELFETVVTHLNQTLDGPAGSA
ncbi:MAG: non-ribosomal peptide synthetase [Pusillimonas sp.]